MFSFLGRKSRNGAENPNRSSAACAAARVRPWRDSGAV
jgi:hypothetical protein